MLRKPSTLARSAMSIILCGSLFFGLCCTANRQVGDTILRDVDDNEYKTVQIGAQLWMAENLRTTRAPDGTKVDSHLPNEDSTKVAEFGRLYDWENALKACPKGWHLPSDDEWKTLDEYLGERDGGGLKDTLFWRSPNVGATNATGFSARPAGYWNGSGFENNFGLRAVYWSSTQQDSHFVWSRTLSHDHDEFRRAPQHPQYGFSIRCIRDN